MSCLYFKIRSKKNKKYCYCIKNKREVLFAECKTCKDKKNRTRQPLKQSELKRKSHRVSRIAKATEIPKTVKEAVLERDKGICIICKKRRGKPNAHLVKRSQNGMGIEENVFCACDICHNEEDNGKNAKEYETIAEQYLKNYYGANWSRDKLVYKKYK